MGRRGGFRLNEVDGGHTSAVVDGGVDLLCGPACAPGYYARAWRASTSKFALSTLAQV